jgi:hypothetical protein
VKWACWRHAHADAASLAARGAPRRFNGVVEGREYRTGIIEKRSPCIGQLDTTRFSAEELNLKFPFERSDLLTERRLLHIKPLCGPGDVPFLSDCDEIAEAAQLDSHTKNV